MEKKKKGPVKVTNGAPAPAAKPKKKRYYPSKPKAKIEAKVKAKEIVEAAIKPTQPEPVVFVWADEAPKKTWIQRVLEWLPFVERK